MAVYTKSSTTLSSSQTISTGSSTTASTSSITNSTPFFSCGVAGTIINGSSAPTVACTAQLQASIDGSTWFVIDQATGSTSASATVPFAFSLIPDGWLYLRIGYVQPTTNSVTVNAVASYGTQFA